jgi:dnd system-associated protein 4
MRAIRRSAKHERLVRQLAEASHPVSKRSLFPTMRELLCFAAVLGFENNARKPLESETAEIDGRIFANHPPTLDLMYLIALACQREVDILRDENEEQMITTFEQYAEGGLEVLEGWLRERPDDENGDRAILSALTKYGYLGGAQPVESAMGEIKF